MRRESAAIQNSRRGQRHGFVLVTMAMAAIALIAALGLAVDVGRMFIAKNETQTYCDSAALAAALAGLVGRSLPAPGRARDPVSSRWAARVGNTSSELSAMNARP